MASFPRRSPTPTNPGRPAGRPAAAPPRARPILVVDDDPDIRHALVRILSHSGHRVLAAADGDAALALSRAHAPGLVVLDYMMPGMDGGAVLAALRDELADAAPPTLLLTASDADRDRAEELGAVEGLEKPFRIPQLLAAVDRYRRRLADDES